MLQRVELLISNHLGPETRSLYHECDRPFATVRAGDFLLHSVRSFVVLALVSIYCSFHLSTNKQLVGAIWVLLGLRTAREAAHGTASRSAVRHLALCCPLVAFLAWLAYTHHRHPGINTHKDTANRKRVQPLPLLLAGAQSTTGQRKRVQPLPLRGLLECVSSR